MKMMRKLYFSWVLILVFSLLSSLLNLSAAASTTIDLSAATTTESIISAKHTTAVEVAHSNGTALQSMSRGLSWSLLGLGPDFLAPKTIKTPYGLAAQHNSPSALTMRSQIQQGGTVYKGGTLGRSETAASQFLATESPLNAGYAGRYGIPPQNANFDFIMTGNVRPGASVVTRPAPGIPPNPGGGIEGVINAGDFMINSFYMP